MGIGDSETARYVRDPHGSHYPHGSGNLIHPPGVADGRPLLITPHGDRERGQSRFSPTVARALTTPHGDREQDRVRASRQERTLSGTHYPSWGSWGSGTSESAVLPDVLIVPSFPPMGSGTPRGGLRLPRRPPQLITPHGDRERRPSRREPRPPRSTHYPHGDREHLGLRPGRAVSIALITPHGDRELAAVLSALLHRG